MINALIFILSVIFSFTQVAAASPATPVQLVGLDIHDSCKELKKHLKPGDLVFTAIDNYVFRELVGKMTQSWASHVGIVFMDENNEWVVMESTLPWSKSGPLCSFLSRTTGNRFEIKRYPHLLPHEVMYLREAAESRMGYLYDTGFDLYSANRQFCSRFIHEVFSEAIGLTLGQPETFQQLKDKHPNVDHTFAKLWFFGQIPWERVTLTPKSQLLDPQLITIVESF